MLSHNARSAYTRFRRNAVMPALVAGIHVFSSSVGGKDVDGRAKRGHDGGRAGGLRDMKMTSIICAALALLTWGASAQEGAKPISKTTISLGTATPGGGFPLYGNNFADVMNAADPTLAIEPRNTKGSYENIPLLEKGGLDLGLVAGEPAYAAFKGMGRTQTNLKISTPLYSSPGMFVQRANTANKTIHDLVGQPIAFGAKGSGLPRSEERRV